MYFLPLFILLVASCEGFSFQKFQPGGVRRRSYRHERRHFLNSKDIPKKTLKRRSSKSFIPIPKSQWNTYKTMAQTTLDKAKQLKNIVKVSQDSVNKNLHELIYDVQGDDLYCVGTFPLPILLRRGNFQNKCGLPGKGVQRVRMRTRDNSRTIIRSGIDKKKITRRFLNKLNEISNIQNVTDVKSKKHMDNNYVKINYVKEGVPCYVKFNTRGGFSYLNCGHTTGRPKSRKKLQKRWLRPRAIPIQLKHIIRY